MKKTNLLIGLAAVIAIVSMNIRHAWMNYGICNKVEAGASSAKGNVCPSKPDDPLVEVNLHQDSTEFRITCIAKIVNTLQKIDSTGVHTITETINNVEDSRTLSPQNANTEGYYITHSDTTFNKYTSWAFSCGYYEEGSRCYSKSAELDCKKLLKMSASY